MLEILFIFWLSSIIINKFAKHHDIKISGQVLTLLTILLMFIFYLFLGTMFSILCMIFMAIAFVMEYACLKRAEIKYGLSWRYALLMTARRALGDL